MSEENVLSIEDYQRAEQFLPWNTLNMAFNTMVIPAWIHKSNQFWYQRQTKAGTEFVLVDPETNTKNLA